MVLKTDGRVGTSSPSSIAVNIPTKAATSSYQSDGRNWFPAAVAIDKKLAIEVSASTNDDLSADCLEEVTVEEVEDEDDDDDDDDGEEEYHDGDGEEDDRSILSVPLEGDEDPEREGPTSDDFAGADITKISGCGPVMSSACRMDFAISHRPNDKSSSREQNKDGIDYIFELVESSLCGGCDATKKRDGMCSEMTIDSKDLPVYKMIPDLRKDSLTGDESSASIPADSYWTHKGSSSRRSSRGRTSSRRREQSSSQRKRPNEEDTPNNRSRSSWIRPDRREESKKKKASDRLAKKASAFIRENVDPALTNPNVSKKLQPGIKKSSYSKPDKSSAFEAACSKTLSSQATEMTQETQITELRELCVLNIGSGSSVSSFDGDGPSWSLHNKQERGASPSRMSVLTALTENASNRTREGRSRISQTDVSEVVHRVLRVLINFLYSLSNTMYGHGAAAPVNKTVCLLSLSFLAVFWPEDREKYRVRVEKQAIRRPEKVSLLHLVTRGGS